MKKKILSGLLAFVMLLSGFQVTFADNNERLKNKYVIDFQLDVNEKKISGTQKIKVVNDSPDEWNKLCFRDYATVCTLSQKKWYRDENGESKERMPDKNSSVLTDIKEIESGESLEYERLPNDPSVIFIPLPTPLKSGETREISFTYQAKLFSGKGNLGWQINDGITTINLGNFYPVLACYEQGDWCTDPYLPYAEYFYSKVADYEVSLKAPNDYTVVGNGEREEKEQQKEETIWKFYATNKRDFVMSASDGFEFLSDYCGDILVNSYYPKGKEMLGKTQLKAAIESLALFSEQLGYPYPYQKFDLICTNLNASGMEYPGLIFMNSGFGINENVLERDLLAYSSVVAHEVGHQWFYGIVGSNSGKQPWLDESFASFTELMYDQIYNSERFKNVTQQLDQFHDNNPSVFAVGESALEMTEIFYTYCAYTSGKQLLYQIKKEIGDDDFFDILKNYVATNAMKEAHTRDFLDILIKNPKYSTAIQPLLEAYLFPNFFDVNEHWATHQISFVSSYGIFNGTSRDLFYPESELSRAMAVAVLYRLSEKPMGRKDISFKDLKADDYFYTSVCWAFGNNITSGVSESEFAPDLPITREAFLTMLYHFDTSEKNIVLEENMNFTDKEEISPWAYEAVSYASASGWIAGDEHKRLNPQKNMTRAEVAVLLDRYILKTF